MRQKRKDIIRDYNIWSNFTYLIAGMYSVILGIKQPTKIRQSLFCIYGILIFIDGVISIIYHMETPAFTGDTKKVYEDKYTILSQIDQYMALSTLLFFIAFISWRIRFVSLKDPMLFFTILFFIISIVFFSLGRHHNEKSIFDCKNDNCIIHNMDSYDIFHSNWHLFTGITFIFSITLLNNSFI